MQIGNKNGLRPASISKVVKRERIALMNIKMIVTDLAEHWRITRSEIAAFGDDLNDIDMLNYAGISVAVGNAIDEAKASADYICGDGDDDGVAKWLEENVL
jgi:hydroxymethylpyrimidine pyrophosphatase-like HAD family hydrolase